MSSYRKLYLSIVGFAVLMAAVIVQANNFWVRSLAGDRVRGEGSVAIGFDDPIPRLGTDVERVELTHIHAVRAVWVPVTARSPKELADRHALHLIVTRVSFEVTRRACPERHSAL